MRENGDNRPIAKRGRRLWDVGMGQKTHTSRKKKVSNNLSPVGYARGRNRTNDIAKIGEEAS